jgi:hypothetical protein
VTLRVRNPLDRPIEVRVRPWTAAETWAVQGECFTSRTAIDAFNPFTVDANTAYRLGEVPAVTVAAGATAEVPLAWKWPHTEAPVAPPTFVVCERFSDSKGRSVPVFQWLRPSIHRTVVGAASMTQARAWPLHAWAPSPYDTLEPDPRASFSLSADGRSLTVRVQTDDAVRAASPRDTRSPEQRMKDPGGDAFRLEWTDDTGPHWLLVEPFTPWQAGSDAGLKAAVRTGDATAPDGRNGWWCEAAVPLDHGLPRIVNLGVADNDQTYHTQWRWLAPTDAPAGFSGRAQP